MIDLELGKLKIVSLAQLETVLAEQWNKVSNGVCINLVESMPTRIQKVISLKGGSCGY